LERVMRSQNSTLTTSCAVTDIVEQRSIDNEMSHLQRTVTPSASG
jgi:hypothetical protein